MDKRIKYRWTEALRSGQYSQATGQLNKEGKGFCCLGVLCEIAVEDGIITRHPDNGDVGYGSAGDMEFSVLPKAVRDWAEIDAAGEYLIPGGLTYSLIRANDDDHLSFQEIADLIEEKF